MEKKYYDNEEEKREGCFFDNDQEHDEEYNHKHEHYEKMDSPKYVATVNNGYIQTKAGIYYKGSAKPIFGNPNEKGYFLLVNPEDSGVNIFMNKTLHSNLGEVPVGIKTYLCAIPKGKLECSDNITNSNTYKCDKKAKGKIFSGKDLFILGGSENYAFTVKGFDTFRGLPNGCILLAPGKCYIAELDSLIDCKGIKGVCTFAWWEEKIEDKKCED